MIDREQALRIARERAAVLGWAFAEPVQVIQRRGWFTRAGRFEVETNVGHKGTKARFTIDATTGAVLSEGFIPR